MGKVEPELVGLLRKALARYATTRLLFVAMQPVGYTLWMLVLISIFVNTE